MKFPNEILVDGVKHRVVRPQNKFQSGLFDPYGGWITFNLDTDQFPGIPCSEHSLTGPALARILQGGWAKSGGHVYKGVNVAGVTSKG